MTNNCEFIINQQTDFISSKNTIVKTLTVTDSLYNSMLDTGVNINNYLAIVDITTYEYNDSSQAPNPEIICFAYSNITYSLLGQIKLYDYTNNILNNGTYKITVYNGHGVFKDVTNVIVNTNNNIIKIYVTGCEFNIWSSRGRTIDNNNFSINSNIRSSNFNNLQLIKTIPVPICDAFSSPTADNNYYYFSTYGSYLNPQYNSLGQLTNTVLDGPGYLIKISRCSYEIVQQVTFSSLTGVSNDFCRNSPVLYGEYLYLGSTKRGKNGTLVCVNKNDLTQVIWSVQLLPGSILGFTGANAIVVDLRKLPDPSTLPRSQCPIQNDPNILLQRQRMLKEHPVVLYIGTSSLEELNAKTPLDRPLQNGNVVCVDALTGEIIWQTSMLPQQYIGGDLLNEDSLRYSTETGLLVDYADCRVPAITGQQLINYTKNVQKEENQIRLYNNSQTTLFFALGVTGSLVPTYLIEKSVLLYRSNGSSATVTFDILYGNTVKSVDANATGQINYSLLGQSAIPIEINGCFILEPLYARDIMSMAEASSMNYTGCSVWGNPIVFDQLRWQLSISTGNNYTIPFDEQNWVQGGLTNQIDQQMLVLVNKYLLDVANNEPQNVIDADLLGIENLTYEQNILLRYISKRGQKNIFNSITSIESSSVFITWSYKSAIADSWTAGQIFEPNASILTGLPWGEDADFGMGAHVYRDPSGDDNNDLYVNISKGGILVSVYANSGQLKFSSIVGPYFAVGAANYSSATDGRYFYAVIVNNNPDIPSYTVILNGDPNQTKTFICQQSYIIKYDPFTGHLLWAVNFGKVNMNAYAQPLVCNDILYVPNLFGYMEMFNICDGSTVAIYDNLPFGGFVPPLILENIMFLTGGYHTCPLAPPNTYYPPCNSIQFYKLL